MGFLVSNDENTVCLGELTIFWTDIGKQYLLGAKKPKNGSIPYYFSLSDCDKNYLINVNLENGFVTDLTGNHNVCLLPTVSDITRNIIDAKPLNASNVVVIDYRNSNMPTCGINTNINDCSYYYDLYPLNTSDIRSSDLMESIWNCYVADFLGTLV